MKRVIIIFAVASSLLLSSIIGEAAFGSRHFFAGKLTEAKLVGVPMTISSMMTRYKRYDLRFGKDGKLYCKTCTAKEWRTNRYNEIEFYLGNYRTATYVYNGYEDALIARPYIGGKQGKMTIKVDRSLRPVTRIDGPNIMED